jgi:hypothetical protein
MDILFAVLFVLSFSSSVFLFVRNYKFSQAVEDMLDKIDKLTIYSNIIFENSAEFNNYLLFKLKSGFLQDNEDIRDLAENMKKFLKCTQDAQQRLINAVDNDYEFEATVGETKNE